MRAEYPFADKVLYQISQRLKQHSGSWRSYRFYGQSSIKIPATKHAYMLPLNRNILTLNLIP